MLDILDYLLMLNTIPSRFHVYILSTSYRVLNRVESAQYVDSYPLALTLLDWYIGCWLLFRSPDAECLFQNRFTSIFESDFKNSGTFFQLV